MRLLCVDVGNTSTALGLYEDGAVSRVAHVPGGILADPEACAGHMRRIASDYVEGVSIASVVPRANARWRRLTRETLGCAPRFVSHESPLGFALDYPHPERIGADRLADAAGGAGRLGRPPPPGGFGAGPDFRGAGRPPARCPRAGARRCV